MCCQQTSAINYFFQLLKHIFNLYLNKLLHIFVNFFLLTIVLLTKQIFNFSTLNLLHFFGFLLINFMSNSNAYLHFPNIYTAIVIRMQTISTK